MALTLMKLEKGSGDSAWINPEHVTSIRKARSGSGTMIRLLDGVTEHDERETDVLADLMTLAMSD